MITTLDDYPLHQTPQPLAIPATSDRNFYDRFWFNGFVGDGSLYFSVAMGFYPNRRVIDGGFSVVVDGQQFCLHLSGDPPLDRTHTELGPLRIETLVPMRRHRIVVNCPARGFEAELLFEAATGAHEEGRQILNDGLHTAMDLTRVTQFGNWSGWIVVKGKRIEVSAARTNGTRDRSWGVRPAANRVGARIAGHHNSTLPGRKRSGRSMCCTACSTRTRRAACCSIQAAACRACHRLIRRFSRATRTR